MSRDWEFELIFPPGAAAAAAAAAAPLFVEKEHMFDKVVTPSDVGKLNRLVIPKQHAEKYFPLDAANSDKGLLLSFEDRTGNSWRFRYSYWNSSQSYVMTKGWSRFVKEKRLDAGDTVSFGRGVGEAARDRFFIDWKRRRDYALNLPCLPRLTLPISSYHHHHHHLGISSMVPFVRSGVPLGHLVWPPSPPPAMTAFDHPYGYNTAAVSNPYLYLRPRGSPLQVAVQVGVGKSGGVDGGVGGDGELGVPIVLDSVPVVKSNAAAKRVRLFGVNLDFPAAEAVSEGEPLQHLQLSIGASEMVDSPRKDKDKSPVFVDLM
ncbi:hypothetical protein Taro_016056 [Colocasia esculenta]|uniref:TF-B3 domain-containing protein n=1 Tax=Colocasia esculenta TaxID=4460 RepID=A0A843URU3_COLES|nr:hypothetical protein [Colocasia esculenta]